RGIAAGRLKQFDAARQYLQTAIDMARPNGNFQQEISAVLVLANNAYQAGDSALAEKYAKGAIELANIHHSEYLAVSGLVSLGTSYARRREFEPALRHLQEALASARRQKSLSSTAVSLYSLAAVHDQTKQYQDAASEAKEALTYYQP